MRSDRKRLKYKRLIGCGIASLLLIVAWKSAPGPTQVWVVVGVPSSPPLPNPGLQFETELGISAWNGLPAAFEIGLKHDPNIFDLVEIKLPQDEAFFPNCITNTDRTSSGETKIGCFQASETDSTDQLLTFATVIWNVRTDIALETSIEIDVEELVEARYRPVEVISFGQHIDFVPPEVDPEPPTSYKLDYNYPNPFRRSTTISYDLPEETFVRLKIYNLLGQLVSTLVVEQQAAGRYVVQWEGLSNAGTAVRSGVYFSVLETASFSESRKMLLVR